MPSCISLSSYLRCKGLTENKSTYCGKGSFKTNLGDNTRNLADPLHNLPLPENEPASTIPLVVLRNVKWFASNVLRQPKVIPHLTPLTRHEHTRLLLLQAERFPGALVLGWANIPSNLIQISFQATFLGNSSPDPLFHQNVLFYIRFINSRQNILATEWGLNCVLKKKKRAKGKETNTSKVLSNTELSKLWHISLLPTDADSRSDNIPSNKHISYDIQYHTLHITYYNE